MGASEVKQVLKDRGKTILGGGKTEATPILQIIEDKEGAWSAILFYPDGRACLVAAGEEWGDVLLTLPKPNT